MATAQTPFDGSTHKATCGDHTIYFDGPESFDEACAEAIKLNGGGAPTVQQLPVNGNGKPTNGGNGKSVAAQPEAPKVERGVGHVDDAGKMRSMVDAAVLKANGFAVEQPYFERGTRVIGFGVGEARRLRAEFEAMPTVGEYAGEFVKQIEGEERRTTDIVASDMRMTSSGDVGVVVNNWQGGGETKVGPTLPMNEDSFKSMLARLGIGGSKYLVEECWPELRAINVNHQMKALGEFEARAHAKWEDRVDSARGVTQARAEKEAGPEPSPRVVRTLTRKNESHPSGREVYGVVSQKYQHRFGMDKVAEALAKAMPSDARGEVAYDGKRARFRVLFHSNVEPADYVAGEFFRVGIGVRTDDTGGGSCIVEGMFWQNLCLNLLCIDEGVTGIARIRHVGSVDALAGKFEEAMAKAKSAISHFVDAWGYGTREDVLEGTLRITHDDDDRKLIKRAAAGIVPVSEALPGLFNGIIERELVPVRGRSKAIPKLIEMYESDTSAARFVEHDGPGGALVARPLSRTAVVNAFTRYAHEGQDDPWQQDEIQSAAGRLLFGKKVGGEGGMPSTWKTPEPLPYVALS